MVTPKKNNMNTIYNQNKLTKIHSDNAIYVYRNNKYEKLKNIHSIKKYLPTLRNQYNVATDVIFKFKLTKKLKLKAEQIAKQKYKYLYNDSNRRTDEQIYECFLRGMIGEFTFDETFEGYEHVSLSFIETPDDGWDFKHKEKGTKVDIKTLRKNSYNFVFTSEPIKDVFYAFFIIDDNEEYAYYIGYRPGELFYKQLEYFIDNGKQKCRICVPNFFNKELDFIKQLK